MASAVRNAQPVGVSAFPSWRDSPISQRVGIRAAPAGDHRPAGTPRPAVAKPEERIDQDANTAAFGLWPTVTHSKLGKVRVDGLPAHLSKTDWKIERGAPCVGEHTDQVLRELLGMSSEEIAKLRAEGIV